MDTNIIFFLDTNKMTLQNKKQHTLDVSETLFSQTSLKAFQYQVFLFYKQPCSAAGWWTYCIFMFISKSCLEIGVHFGGWCHLPLLQQSNQRSARSFDHLSKVDQDKLIVLICYACTRVLMKHHLEASEVEKPMQLFTTSLSYVWIAWLGVLCPGPCLVSTLRRADWCARKS